MFQDAQSPVEETQYPPGSFEDTHVDTPDQEVGALSSNPKIFNDLKFWQVTDDDEPAEAKASTETTTNTKKKACTWSQLYNACWTYVYM